MGIELTNTDHSILTLLTIEPCTSEELVRSIGETAEQIDERLEVMKAQGYLRETNDTPPRYELLDDPR